MRMLNVHEAKTHLSRLLDDVKNGEEIILAKDGKPYARLVPIQPQKVPMGFLKGNVDSSIFSSMSEEELDDWEKPFPI